MSCRDAYEANMPIQEKLEKIQRIDDFGERIILNDRLLFGVESSIQSDDVLQNNLEMFDWAAKNKIYPNFWGRNIVGEDCLTKEEITYLHKKGCKIATIYKSDDEKISKEQGEVCGKKAALVACELGITKNTAIFLEVEDGEKILREYMQGYATELLAAGYTPGFKANTDATFEFDHEFCRGLIKEKELFDKCLIWATTPIIEEYDGLTNSHSIHPDNWKPFTPSGLEREDIAIWQYGKECHPIKDDEGRETSFNLNLVRKEQVIIENMF